MEASVPPPAPRDRTGAVVSLGLVLLALVGVLTVFGESIAAALFPSGT
jgi:hypothetical protein